MIKTFDQFVNEARLYYPELTRETDKSRNELLKIPDDMIALTERLEKIADTEFEVKKLDDGYCLFTFDSISDEMCEKIKKIVKTFFRAYYNNGKSHADIAFHYSNKDSRQNGTYLYIEPGFTYPDYKFRNSRNTILGRNTVHTGVSYDKEMENLNAMHEPDWELIEQEFLHD